MSFAHTRPMDARATRPASTLTAPMTQSPPDAVRTLHPGDVAVAERGEVLSTLLGSCVAILLTDPRRTIGVMCHIVHSRPPLSHAQSSTSYGSVAITAMDRLLLARGISLHLCEAYVYGGGNMFPGLITQSHVGDANALWTLTTLRERGVRVVGQDLGGRVYRRLRWTVGADAPEVSRVPV
jgi:chemotaxis protein CheD